MRESDRIDKERKRMRDMKDRGREGRGEKGRGEGERILLHQWLVS
jgi:hypothetical protein